MGKRVHDPGLGQDKGWKSVEVDRVDAPVDEPVAGQGNENQHVNSGVERGPNQESKCKQAMGGPGHYEKRGEAPKGCGGQRAGGQQLQPTVKLGFLSPIDGQDERNRERRYVKERNQQIGLRIPCVENGFVESCHGDGRGEANDGHRDAKHHAEPADSLVPADLTCLNQRRLKNEEE